MISVRGVAWATVVGAMVLMAAGATQAAIVANAVPQRAGIRWLLQFVGVFTRRRRYGLAHYLVRAT